MQNFKAIIIRIFFFFSYPSSQKSSQPNRPVVSLYYKYATLTSHKLAPIFAKQQADLANPLGYGHKNIGSSGDMRELEYLLLSTHLSYIAEKCITIFDDPSRFKCLICFCLV